MHYIIKIYFIRPDPEMNEYQVIFLYKILKLGRKHTCCLQLGMPRFLFILTIKFCISWGRC